MMLPDAVRRAIRTFIQAAIGTFLAAWAAAYTNPGVLPPVDALQRIVIAASVAGVIAVLTLIQNLLEDHTPLPAIGKAPPSGGKNPVPDPNG